MVIRDRALSCLTLFSVCASEAEGLLKLPDPPEVICCPCLNLNTRHTYSEMHTRNPQALPEMCGTTCLDGNNNSDDREAVCALAASMDWESQLQSSVQNLAPSLASCATLSKFPNLFEPQFAHP